MDGAEGGETDCLAINHASWIPANKTQTRRHAISVFDRTQQRREEMKGRGKKTGVGGGRGTGLGRGKGGLAKGPQNATGPRAKAGTCVRKKK